MELNKNQVQAVLEDLYQIEPSLRRYESELKKLIEEIVAIRPDVNFDENFRAQLRAQLMAKAAELSQKPASSFSFMNIFSNKFSYALAGSLAVLIIVIGGAFAAQKQGLVSFSWPSVGTETGEVLDFSKTVLNKNAFGKLSAPQSAAPSASGEMAYGRGGGGGGMAVTDSASAPSPDGKGMPMIYPVTTYKYIYKGEPLELKDSSVEVLRRKGFDPASAPLNSFLGKVGSGLAKLSSFGNFKMQNITASNDEFIISVDFASGSFFISPNWSKVTIGSQERFQISQVLSDAEIIAMADDFAKSHGISLKNYGAPQVMNDWKREYEKAEDKSQFYISDTASVTYPLIVDGRTVLDEGGNPTGINISVNMRDRKVTGVSNITSLAFEASGYAAETDFQKILAVAERGGNWNYYPAEGQNVIEIELGVPKTEFVSMFNNANGRMDYLLVPSLVFPVVKTPQNPNYYYPKFVVVPLAKDLIRQNDVYIMRDAVPPAPAGQ